MGGNRREAERYLLDWMRKNTDEDHPISITGMKNILSEEFDLDYQSRTVSGMLKNLRAAGILEECPDERDARNRAYYYDDWTFDRSELLFLMYSVLANRSIPARQARDLVKRIRDFGGIHFDGSAFDDLLKDRDGPGAETHNREFFFNLDVIHDAIIGKKQISFTYCKYDVDKRLHGVTEHTVSPYYVTMKDQDIYLTAYSEQQGEITLFRVDHIRDVKIIPEDQIEITQAPGYDEDIDYRRSNSVIPSTIIEKQENILFRADRSIVDDIVENFSEAVLISNDPDDESKVIANIKISPHVMECWAKQYLDHVEILAPPKLRRSIYASLCSNLSKYESASSITEAEYALSGEMAQKNADQGIDRTSRHTGETGVIRKPAQTRYSTGKFIFEYDFSESDEDCLSLTPDRLIDKLVDQINKSGSLIVPERPYLTPASEEGSKWLRCDALFEVITDAEVIKREFALLFDTLAEIAALNRRETVSSMELRRRLSKEAYLLWRNYIQDIGNGRFEKDIERSAIKLISRHLSQGYSERTIAGASLHLFERDPVREDEEIFLYWNHVYEIKAAARDRCMHQGNFNFDELIRAKRLYDLMLLNAPEELINREARRLALYMVLDQFPCKVNSFTSCEGIGVPLYHVMNTDTVSEILTDPALYYPMEPNDPVDPHNMMWEEIYYMKADHGEEIISAYDDLGEFDEAGCREVALWLWRNKELNPKGIYFEGIDASNAYGRGWPDFILFPDEPFAPDEDRTGITEEDAVTALKAFARTIGIEETLVGWYRIPWI